MPVLDSSVGGASCRPCNGAGCDRTANFRNGARALVTAGFQITPVFGRAHCRAAGWAYGLACCKSGASPARLMQLLMVMMFMMRARANWRRETHRECECR